MIDWRLNNILNNQDLYEAMPANLLQDAMLHATEVLQSPWVLALVVDNQVFFFNHYNGMPPYLIAFIMDEEEYNTRVSQGRLVPIPQGQFCYYADVINSEPGIDDEGNLADVTPDVSEFVAYQSLQNPPGIEVLNLIFYKSESFVQQRTTAEDTFLYERFYFVQKNDATPPSTTPLFLDAEPWLSATKEFWGLRRLSRQSGLEIFAEVVRTDGSRRGLQWKGTNLDEFPESELVSWAEGQAVYIIQLNGQHRGRVLEFKQARPRIYDGTNMVRDRHGHLAFDFPSGGHLDAGLNETLQNDFAFWSLWDDPNYQDSYSWPPNIYPHYLALGLNNNWLNFTINNSSHQLYSDSGSPNPGQPQALTQGNNIIIGNSNGGSINIKIGSDVNHIHWHNGFSFEELRVGGSGTVPTAGQWRGVISEVGLFNRTLLTIEIADLYSNLNGFYSYY